MSDKIEPKQELEAETSDARLQPEIFSEAEPPKERKVERFAETAEEIGKLKQKIEGIIAGDQPIKQEKEDAALREKRIAEYQKRYLPPYIRERGFISKAITSLWAGRVKFEKEGQENIPEKGPFIVIWNHFGGGDVEALLRTFKDVNLHFAVAKEMWWSNPVAKWFLKRFGMIPVEESLANLTDEQKEAALKNQGGNGQKIFRKIIDREKQGKSAANVEFIRQAVAVLSRGDGLAISPAGLWLNPEGPGKLREKAEMQKGYRGIELIAEQYKKLTGEELPIVPTAFLEDKATGKKIVVVGESIKLSDNDSDLNGTDWCMKHVAGMLPEDQRGYYK